MRYLPAKIPVPNTIAIAAPNPAADAIPSIYGSASGFFRAPCIAAPAVLRAIPAKSPP